MTYAFVVVARANISDTETFTVPNLAAFEDRVALLKKAPGVQFITVYKPTQRIVRAIAWNEENITSGEIPDAPFTR